MRVVLDIGRKPGQLVELDHLMEKGEFHAQLEIETKRREMNGIELLIEQVGYELSHSAEPESKRT